MMLSKFGFGFGWIIQMKILYFADISWQTKIKAFNNKNTLKFKYFS